MCSQFLQHLVCGTNQNCTFKDADWKTFVYFFWIPDGVSNDSHSAAAYHTHTCKHFQGSFVHERTCFRTKTFQGLTNKHFNEYIFFLHHRHRRWINQLHNAKTETQNYIFQPFLFIFDRVSEPVQICNCYHLEARNVTGDRLARTNWNHYSPMSLVPVKIWLLRNVVSYCIQACAPPNCPELL